MNTIRPVGDARTAILARLDRLKEDRARQMRAHEAQHALVVAHLLADADDLVTKDAWDAGPLLPRRPRVRLTGEAGADRWVAGKVHGALTYQDYRVDVEWFGEDACKGHVYIHDPLSSERNRM